MNRYIIALLGLIGLLVINSLVDGREAMERVTRSSRTAISANPSSAQQQNGLSGIEAAGQNVTRQTSVEGIEQSQQNVPAQNPTTSQTNTTGTAGTSGTAPLTQVNPVPPATTPVTPTTPPPTNQEAIPALW